MRDERAKFEALVERQSRFVFRVAYAVVRDRDEAEDVVQETFLKLFRNGGWESMRDERAFLARVAWRIAVDRPKQLVRGEVVDAASDGESPEDAAVRGDAVAFVHRLVDALPEELRRVMALSGIEEMNSREIAAVVGVPEGTVRTRLMRARAMLKEKMAAMGRPCGPR